MEVRHNCRFAPSKTELTDLSVYLAPWILHQPRPCLPPSHPTSLRDYGTAITGIAREAHSSHRRLRYQHNLLRAGKASCHLQKKLF